MEHRYLRTAAMSIGYHKPCGFKRLQSCLWFCGDAKRAISARSHMQVTALIRKDTHTAVWHRLLDEVPKREFSELLEDLPSN
jgi:hypothetical protein